jgi:tRNA threonylcarbamoyl adenosine modification protein YeaZ
MNVLAMDTATPTPSIVVLSGERIFEEVLSGDRRASEELLPAVGRALSRAGLRLADLDRVAVCSGPGSFTGIRVGLATAWGFGRALGVDVEAVPTLEAMAEGARGFGAERVVAVLDAGRGEVVAERFDLASPRARSLGASRRVAPGNVAASRSGDSIVSLPADLVPGASDAPLPAVAVSLARAVAREPHPGGALEAIYSRPSAAEEKHVAP